MSLTSREEVNLTKKLNLEIKNIGDDRTVEAYATTFGNKDLDGDVMERGCLDKYLSEEFDGYLPMHFNHMTYELPFGKWTDIKIDEKGALAKGVFFNTTQGKDAHEVLRQKMIKAVSIGFRAKKYEETDTGYSFKEISLRELSLVKNPANEQAVITDLKNNDTMARREVCKFLMSRGFSKEDSEIFIDSGYNALEVEKLAQEVLKSLKEN